MAALTARLELSAPARVLLATLLVAAGAIHLAMVPAHADGSTFEGVTFAVAGCVQLLLGVLVVQRPSWLMLGVIAVVSAVSIGAWAVSRTTGLPYGAHQGVAESATQVDVTTVLLEFATVALVAALVFAPRLGHDLPRATVALAALLPLVALVATAAALSSPGALDHGHSDSDTAASAGGHVHGSSDTTSEPVVTPVASVDEAPLDADGRQRLLRQLTRARAVMAEYPTVADARRVGMYDATSTGAAGPRYFVNPANLPYAADPGFDLEKPLVYLYAGDQDTSPVVGLAYVEFSERGPRGFVGPDDEWRLTGGLCTLPVRDGSLIMSIDTDVSRDACVALDGSYADSVQWTLHAWVAPGWENPDGVFAEANPRIACVVDAYVRWLGTAGGGGQPGAAAGAALVDDLEACSRGAGTDESAG